MAEPAVILVEPQLPENIGAAARAMMNFGLSELRLVAPRENWPNERAYDLAGHAAPVLDGAKVFATTREAAAGFTRLYAATARAREMTKPVLNPDAAAARMRAEPGRVALLFGPERTGLANEDLALADALVTIPTAPTLASLNLAQSVVVLGYEWFAAGEKEASRATTGPAASPLVSKSAPASKEELASLFDHLERELDATDFWKAAEKKPKMWLNLRNIFARANLTEQEARSLHGVIAALRGKG